MSEYQEEVLTNLLDLQAELRGDEPPSGSQPEQAPPPSTTERAPGDLAVSEQGLTVSVSRRSAPPPLNERLAALNERLARLERNLAGVTQRIDRLGPEADDGQPAEPEPDVDAPWRSFLDLQKMVADRLDQR